MAELFGRMPYDNADYFTVRRLDMSGRKIELSTPSISSPIHCFFFLETGEALLNIGEESHLFKPGECATIPAGQVFSVRYFDNCTGYMGGFSTDFINLAGSNPIQAYGSFRRRGYRKVAFRPEHSAHIALLFSRLSHEHTGTQNPNIIKAYLTALLTEIDEISDHSPIQNLSSDNSLCDRFIHLVFNDETIETSAGPYAFRLNISQDYLQKTVKRFTGRTPLSWIHESIILRSKHLLIHTDLTVGEITAQVGMDDPAYFSRLFKKHTGFSPSEYRKDKKSNNRPE